MTPSPTGAKEDLLAGLRGDAEVNDSGAGFSSSPSAIEYYEGAARRCRLAADTIESLRASLTRVEEENARILGLLKEERDVANADLERFVEIGDKWSARFMEGGRDVCDEVLRQIALGNPPTGLSRDTSAEGK